MKKYLTLTVLALTLAACSTSPRPPDVEIQVTGTYTYAVSPTQTVVSVRPGKLGTRFCYTDRTLAGVQVCNNLTTGQRTVQSGYALGVVFSEPDAAAGPALTRP